jgi:hypothetical protein
MLYLILKFRGYSALRGGSRGGIGLIDRAAGGGWCLVGGLGLREENGKARRVAEQLGEGPKESTC